MSTSTTGFDDFRRVTSATMTGVRLGHALRRIDFVEKRLEWLGREPSWNRRENAPEGDLAVELHALRRLVARHEGKPLPPDPTTPQYESTKRRAQLQREFVAKRQTRPQPDLERSEPTGIIHDPRQMMLF